MAAPTGGYVFKDFDLSIDDVDVSNQATKAMLKPTTDIKTLKTLVPDGVIQDVDLPVWTFELTALQDNTALTGIAAVLRAAAGSVVEVVLAPHVGTGKPQATFNITAMHSDFGGAQGDWNTFDLSLPVTGQPVFGAVPA